MHPDIAVGVADTWPPDLDEAKAQEQGREADSEKPRKSGKKPVMVQAALDMAEHDASRLLEKA